MSGASLGTQVGVPGCRLRYQTSMAIGKLMHRPRPPAVGVAAYGRRSSLRREPARLPSTHGRSANAYVVLDVSSSMRRRCEAAARREIQRQVRLAAARLEVRRQELDHRSAEFASGVSWM